jgi:hypothetical protein
MNYFKSLGAWLLFAGATPLFANIPGGTGTGVKVTMTVNTSGGTPYIITLANGIVSATIKTSTAQIIYLTYTGRAPRARRIP